MAFNSIVPGQANNVRITVTFLSWVIGFICTESFAQNLERAAIRVGETSLTPAIRIEFGQSDNALRRDSNELEETFSVVQPDLLWSTDRGVTIIDAGYKGEYKISDQDITDYDDHIFSGGFRTEFSKRSSFQASGRISFQHLEIGRDVFTRSDPLLFDQVEFERQQINFAHTFGAARARGRLTSSFRIDNLDYTNNDEVTQDSGRLLYGPRFRFSYRLSGDTRAFVTASLTEIDRSGNGENRTDLDLSVGASWSITGARIGLFYLPRSFSRFELNFEREFFNNGAGNLTDAAIRNQLDVVWQYDWSSRLFHRAELNFGSVERSCPEVGDQTTEFSLEAGLNVRRWLSLGIGGELESRENGSCSGMFENLNDAPDYDRQELFAFVRFSL